MWCIFCVLFLCVLLRIPLGCRIGKAIELNQVWGKLFGSKWKTKGWDRDVLPEGNVRNFIFKHGVPQVPEDGVGKNSSVQGDGNSVHSAHTFVMICD